MDASVYIQSGRQSGTKLPLRAAATTFGRSSVNDVQLLDREISRQHFELVRDAAAFCLRDLGSVNGTFVNGQRTDYCQLETGDVIRAGQTEFLFTAGQAVKALAPTPGLSVHLVREAKSPEQNAEFSGGSESTARPSAVLRLALEVEAKSRSGLDFVQEAFQSLGPGKTVDELFGQILERIFSWVKVDRACIVLGGGSDGEFIVKAGRLREPSQDSTMRVSKAILRYVQSRNVGILTHDARDDSRWDDSDLSSAIGVHEAICVPMPGRSGFLGAIYVDTFQRPGGLGKSAPTVLTEDHLQIMLGVGKLAGLALENTRYHEELVVKTRLAAVGETIATLSHHIKNILQGLNGGTYLLEQGLQHKSPEDTQRGWEIVRRYQDKISRLVLDMLSYSRERQPDWAVGDLNRTVAECVELVAPRAESLGVKLVCQPVGDFEPFEFDGHALGHAITNLLQNAIEACERVPDRQVEVSVVSQPAAGLAQIVVRDSGHGIPEAELGKLFELFHSTKGNRGTGLGLAVSRKIVQEHGGEITVESLVGRGSRFTITLPTLARDRNAGQKRGPNGAQDAETLLQPKFKSTPQRFDS